jgi:FAD/FMN-containing dehydrogenase
MAEISESELEELTARLDGRVHRPGDAAYARAAAPKNSSGDQRPAAVVAAGDVAACVRWAAEHGRQLAVQATGHGAAGTVGTDVVLVVTAQLDAVEMSGPRVQGGGVFDDRTRVRRVPRRPDRRPGRL